MQMRDYLIEKIYKEARKNKKIIFISNEQGASALDKFREKLPKQFINAGISEQNIISVAAGMAKAGKKVYVYSIASFITLRCFEQLKIDLNIMNLPVTILGVGASYSYDNAGPTHHSIEDISILRTLSNFEIYSPSDNLILDIIFKKTLMSKKPSYVRLDREMQKNINREKKYISGLSVIKSGKKKLVITTGVTTQIINSIKNLLPKQKKYAHLDLIKIAPINHNIIKKIINKFKEIITVEEHVLEGGIGSILSEVISDCNLNIKLTRVAISKKNRYIYHQRKISQKIHGLDEKSLKKII